MIQNHDCKVPELLIRRMTKAYINVLFNNEMRNTLIEEKICSLQHNSQIKCHSLGSIGGQSMCGEVISLQVCSKCFSNQA